MPETDLCFSIPKAAKHCSISRVTLWRWVRSGKLKAFLTPGGQYRIREEDLEFFISEKMEHLSQAEFLKEKKILIVDDDASVQKLLAKMLSANGFRTEVASDGFEAGVKTVQFKPDLMVLDLYMPGMDGFEICKQIKENSITSHIKILAITGYNTQANEDQILEAGADGYLVKPVERKTLLQNVDDLLK